jgi:hypothetical protein
LSLFSRKDYVEQMIEQIANFMAKILGLSGKGDYDGALALVREACSTALGTPYELLDAVAAGSAADLIRDPITVRMYAKLMAEEANILTLKGDAAAGAARRLRALQLYVEAELRGAPPDSASETAIVSLSSAADTARLERRYTDWLSHRKT